MDKHYQLILFCDHAINFRLLLDTQFLVLKIN